MTKRIKPKLQPVLFSFSFSFDDVSFGMTSDGTVVDRPFVLRPRYMKTEDWYKFAGKLQTKLQTVVQQIDIEALNQLDIRDLWKDY